MAQYRSSLLIVICLTVVGLSPSPSRASVRNSEKQGAIAPSSQIERSLWDQTNPGPKLALELAQAEKKKKADSGVPKPVRVVLRLLRGRKTLLALSLLSVLITGMAVFILLKLFDDGQREYDEGDYPPEEVEGERSLEPEVHPVLEEQSPYFEATEPVFKSEVEIPNASAAGETDKFITQPRSQISPLAEQEVVVETWSDVSEEVAPPTYHTENDNNGNISTVLQPAEDIEVEAEIQTKFQEEDSYTSTVWETSTPAIAPAEVDRPSEEIKDSVGVSQRSDREVSDRHRADIELTKETPPAPPVNVVEQLIEQLQDTEPQSRHNAIWQLGEKGDSRAIEPLVHLLRESDSKQQSMILATLSQIGNKTLKPMVRALSLSLQNDNKEVRINAIRDLTDVYEVVISVTNLLQYAVDDPDDNVRETAKWALEKLNRIRPPRNLDL